jgi:hypothetical protein
LLLVPQRCQVLRASVNVNMVLMSTPFDAWHTHFAPPFYRPSRSGRPDIKEMIATITALADEADEARVAVLVCGPPALMKEVLTACDAHNGLSGLLGGKVLVDLHRETFAL